MGTTILIVDDSQVDRRLVAGLLQKQSDWKLESAEDGQEALQRLAASKKPNLVVTDLVMPHMDGLDLVRAMRKKHPTIPVVLMTAYGNEEIAVEALEEGAASYVPKAQQAERLVETVRRVLARAEADRRRRRIATRLHEASCTYRLENDPAMIGPLLDEIQRTMAAMNISDSTERVRTCLAVEEALLNAMYHGNLEFSKKQIEEARADYHGGGLTALVQRKRGLPDYEDREVSLSARFTKESARFVIRDDGRGFRLEHTLANRLDDYFALGKSRGLMLLYSVMDEVKFNDRGNEVVLLKTCPPATRKRINSTRKLVGASRQKKMMRLAH